MAASAKTRVSRSFGLYTTLGHQMIKWPNQLYNLVITLSTLNAYRALPNSWKHYLGRDHLTYSICHIETM
jgi:hypothetical protein